MMVYSYLNSLSNVFFVLMLINIFYSCERNVREIKYRSQYLNTNDCLTFNNTTIESRSQDKYFFRYYYDYPRSTKSFDIFINQKLDSTLITEINFSGSSSSDSIVISQHLQDYKILFSHRIQEFKRLKLCLIHFNPKTGILGIETLNKMQYRLVFNFKFWDSDFYQQCIQLDSNLFVFKEKWSAR